VIWNNTVLLVPLKAAETTIEPEADDRVVAEKPALLEPWGTATVAGTASAALLLARVTTIFPTEFDMVTVHALLEPAAMLVGTQVSEDNSGAAVPRRPMVAVALVLLSVAVIVAV
jgi:hypothetical protein